MNNRFTPSRRGALALGAGLAFTAALPAFAQDAKPYVTGDVVMGDENAAVTIYEYASLTCPHCAAFHDQSWAEVKTELIDSGKAKFILREVYFDQFGLWASMVARCGGEMNYYRLAETFLGEQKTWYLDHVRAFNETKNAQPMIAEIMKIGRRAGLSNEQMNACLSDEEMLKTLVTDFQTNTQADGINSTPTFIINGETVKGAVPAATIIEAVEKHL